MSLWFRKCVFCEIWTEILITISINFLHQMILSLNCSTSCKHFRYSIWNHCCYLIMLINVVLSYQLHPRIKSNIHLYTELLLLYYRRCHYTCCWILMPLEDLWCYACKNQNVFSKCQPSVVQCVYQINMFSSLQNLITPQKLLILILNCTYFCPCCGGLCILTTFC